MKDLNEKYSERLQRQRRKAYNWPKLIVMTLVLVAILFLMNILNKSGNISQVPMAETADSSAVYSPAVDTEP